MDKNIIQEALNVINDTDKSFEVHQQEYKNKITTFDQAHLYLGLLGLTEAGVARFLLELPLFAEHYMPTMAVIVGCFISAEYFDKHGNDVDKWPADLRDRILFDTREHAYSLAVIRNKLIAKGIR